MRAVTAVPGPPAADCSMPREHLVGSLTLGRSTADASGYESCPVSAAPAPDGTNGTNDFTSLAAVWDSSADPTGTTATLASVLDPEGAGTLQTASAPAASVAFTTSLATRRDRRNGAAELERSGATACSAGGGMAGDGWSGSVGASAAQSVSESTAATVTYLLNCVLPGGRSVSAAVTITWSPPAPVISFTSPGTLWAGRAASLEWSSNEAPCSITGGALAATGLGSSGSITTTQSTPGYVQYQISCGSGTGQSVSATTQVQFVAPDVLLQANGTDRRTGEEFYLTWQSYADSCTPSGGAPGDGWTGTAFPDPSVTSRFDPTVSTTGTYTYTLTCFSGALSVTRSLAVTFEDAVPYATLAIERTSEASPARRLTDQPQLELEPVQLHAPVLACNWRGAPGERPAGWRAPVSHTRDVLAAGGLRRQRQWTERGICRRVLAVLAPPPPTASIAVSPGTLTAGGHFTVSWTSSYASDCEGSGAPPDVGWEGTQTASGSRDFTSAMVGSYAITISCHAVWGALPADLRAGARHSSPRPPCSR